MKRFFILASAAIVALASCAKTEIRYDEQPQEIAFKQITSAMTKANVSELTTNMGVFAVLSETQAKYFSNVTFAPTGETGNKIWKATPDAMYYPLQEKLDFAFYAPHAADWKYSTDSDKQELTSCEYTDVKSTDVLFGEEIIDDAEKRQTAYPITLKHALAKVSIKVQANVANLVTITKITLTGVQNSGILTVNYDDDQLSTAVWSSTKTSDYVWADSKMATTDPVDYGTPYYFIAANYGETDKVEQTELVVNYTIGDYDGEAILDLSGDVKAYWDMSKHYIYTINATAYEITFDADVEDMTEMPEPEVL